MCSTSRNRSPRRSLSDPPAFPLRSLPITRMIKNDGSFNPESCRVFGLAAHTLAALLSAVVHNLEQTRRARRPKKSNNIAADHAEQRISDTTPPDAPTQRPGQSTPTRAPP